MTYGASVAGMTSPLAKYFVKRNMKVFTLAWAAAVASVRYGCLRPYRQSARAHRAGVCPSGRQGRGGVSQVRSGRLAAGRAKSVGAIVNIEVLTHGRHVQGLLVGHAPFVL
jgi:hypothetical protein